MRSSSGQVQSVCLGWAYFFAFSDWESLNSRSKISNKTTSAEVWKHLNKLRSRTVNKKIVLKENGKYINEPKEVANLLANHFAERSNGKSDMPEFEDFKEKEETNEISCSKMVWNKTFFTIFVGPAKMNFLLQTTLEKK